MSYAQDIVDEFIYHAHIQERFKTRQSRKMRRYINQLNRHISTYLEIKRTVSTKRDYARLASWIREQTNVFSTQLIRIFKRDIRGQIQAEKEWMQKVLPFLENMPSDKTVLNKCLFGTFNGVYSVESYIKEIANRILKLWTGQIRIAYTTGADLNWVIQQVLGR